VDKPLVSICVPTYNGARYLKACLDSAVEQTYRSIEIVVVDDHSTDETPEIAEDFVRTDHRVRLIRNPRRLGLVDNWNRSVELARGSWVKLLFQDDLLESSCVERMLAAAGSAGPPIVACGRRFLFEDTAEDVRGWYEWHAAEESLQGVLGDERLIPAERLCDAVLEHVGQNFIGEPTAVLVKRAAFERFGVFNPDLIAVPDLEYWIRVGANTGLALVPETLATFRVHPASASSANARERKYRLFAMDPLILLHQFAYHPAFSRLRTRADLRDPPVDLRAMFGERALRARTGARRAVEDGSFESWAEWGDLASRYPEIRSSPPVMRARFRRLRGRIRSHVARAAHGALPSRDVAR
jgi:glycosyltransferase involved in cell wall biosynthesis